MTTPRAQIVDLETPGFYHCVSRCVRRAFLCGTDSYSGRSFEHRKAWVETRLLELAEIFAVGVYAFAVMSNHVHVVTYLDPGVAWSWSPEEVAGRWMRLCPVRANGQIDAEATELRRQAMADNPARIAVCRARLAIADELAPVRVVPCSAIPRSLPLSTAPPSPAALEPHSNPA